jgi:hypothetical protein
MEIITEEVHIKLEVELIESQDISYLQDVIEQLISIGKILKGKLYFILPEKENEDFFENKLVRSFFVSLFQEYPELMYFLGNKEGYSFLLMACLGDYTKMNDIKNPQLFTLSVKIPLDFSNHLIKSTLDYMWSIGESTESVKEMYNQIIYLTGNSIKNH